MLRELQHKLFRPGRAAGVEITFISESALLVNCVIAENIKGKAVISKRFNDIRSFSDLAGKIPASIPVSLVINGKGLIHKKVQGISPDLLQSILPGVNPLDFLSQSLRLNDGFDLAIIRKNVPENIISQLTELNVKVVALSLGFCDIQYLTSQINHTGEFQTNQYCLAYENQLIENYRLIRPEEREAVIKPELSIGEEYIKSKDILAFAAAVKLLVYSQPGQLNPGLEVLEKNRSSLLTHKKFQIYGVGFLVGILLLLVINFLIYSHYYSLNEELVSKYSVSLNQAEKIKQLKESIDSKVEFLGSAGWLNDKKIISYTADRIAATIPDSVTLLSLTIYPSASKSTFDSKQWIFQRDTVIISGNCNDPSLLDQWTAELRKVDNVRQAAISSYAFNNKTGSGLFTAQVYLK